jgi:hypothetical protein
LSIFDRIRNKWYLLGSMECLEATLPALNIDRVLKLLVNDKSLLTIDAAGLEAAAGLLLLEVLVAALKTRLKTELLATFHGLLPRRGGEFGQA